VRVSCDVNHWVFQVADNVKVHAQPQGLYVEIPGVTGSPDVRCSNAPDASVDDPSLKLRFTFPWAEDTVETEASLGGDWHVLGPGLDFLVDMSGRISGAVGDSTRDMLNSGSNKKAFWNAFGAVAKQYASQVRHEEFDKLGYIISNWGELEVTYWVK
jgi:hypothetical protein